MMENRALTVMVIILFVLVSLSSIGSVGASEVWSQTYGGLNLDVANSLIKTSDGGYAIVGETTSFGAGGYDAWLVKTDAYGNQQWNQTYGGTDDDYGEAVIQTSDGGYAIAGRTWSFDYEDGDFWLVKTDSDGNHQWNKTYGYSGIDQAYSLVQAPDGGFVLVGDRTYSGKIGVMLVKTFSNGIEQLSRTYVGDGNEYAYSVTPTSDGGYAIAGRTSSSPALFYDSLLIKTDWEGNFQWKKMYGGTASDSSRSVIQTNDGGYVLAGQTTSSGAGSLDFWLVKTDSDGNQQWNKTYGGTSGDYLSSMVATSDGGFALTGRTWSYGAGDYDAWLVKTDAEGNMEWTQTDGGTGFDGANSLVVTSDGGYALAGSTTSFGIGSADFWLIKTNEPVIIPDYHDLTLSVSGSGSTSPSVGTHTYVEDTDVNVTASASSGWSFSHWTLDSVNVGSANPYTVTMDGNHTLSAVFTEIPPEGNGDNTSFEVATHNVTIETNTYVIETFSNSSVSELVFDGTAIRFHVDGALGTAGFCNVTIPSELMSGDFSIYKDDTLLIKDVDYTGTYNGTHYLFSITYEHSTHTIEITATIVIPEFSSLIMLSLLSLATLTVITSKKKLKRSRDYGFY